MSSNNSSKFKLSSMTWKEYCGNWTSNNLAPCDFFLLTKLKIHLSSKEEEDIKLHTISKKVYRGDLTNVLNVKGN